MAVDDYENKKAELSQRGPCDGPYIMSALKICGSP